MKVDMSPEAISRRLKTMGELWDLGIALSRSRSLDGVELRPPRRRVTVIQDAIRKVLIDDWDPIGVRGVAGAVDEYDSYIGRIYQILRGSRSANDLVDCLARIEQAEIGVSTTERSRRDVAAKLLDLKVGLDQDYL